MAIRRELNHHNWRWVVYSKDGKGRRRRKFFRDDQYEEAMRWHLAMGQQRHVADGPTYSIQDIFQGFLNGTRHRRGSVAQASTVSRMKLLLKVADSLSLRYAHELSDTTFARIREGLQAAGYAEHSIHGYLGVFRAAIRYAQRRGALPAAVITDMELPEPQKTRTRYLSQEEIVILLAHLAGHPVQRPVALGIFQGLRIAETCRLTEGDLDLQNRRISIGGRVQERDGHRVVLGTKNHSVRVLRLHPRVLEFLPTTVGGDSVPLCLNTQGRAWSAGSLSHNLRRRLDELGEEWKDVSYHVLRHSFASHLAISGKFSLFQIMQVLGHRNVKTTLKYAHLMPDSVQPDF